MKKNWLSLTIGEEITPARNTTLGGVRNTQEENLVFADFNIISSLHIFVNDVQYPRPFTFE